MAIKPRLRPNIITGRSEMYIPLNSSEEARICLECPLPAEQCKNPLECKRYKEEREKLLKGAKNG